MSGGARIQSRAPGSTLLPILPCCLLRRMQDEFGSGSVWGPLSPSGGPTGLRVLEGGLEGAEWSRREAKK